MNETRRSPNAWPPRSPDLTPLDIFLWSYTMNLIHHVRNNDLQQSKGGTKDAVATVTHNILQNTWTEIEYRLDIYCIIRGADTLKYKVGSAIKILMGFPLKWCQLKVRIIYRFPNNYFSSFDTYHLDSPHIRVYVPKENGMRDTGFSKAPGVQSRSAPAYITRHGVDGTRYWDP